MTATEKAEAIDAAIAWLRVAIARDRSYDALITFALNETLSDFKDDATAQIKARFFDLITAPDDTIHQLRRPRP